jgi:zinc transport system permease protein
MAASMEERAMFEIFYYEFMIRACIAGLLIAVTVPVMGSFLVARRYSLISDSLAHVSLAGVGLGLLFGTAPVVIAAPVTIAGALLLEWLRQRKQISGEVSLAILMSGGLAIAVVLANMAHGAQADFSSYLFGSIATTTTADVIVLAGAAVLVLVFIATSYRALLHIAFDEDSARIMGYRVELRNYVLAGLTALVVVLSLRVVGGLLISALLVIPVVTAGQVARSFKQTMIGAVCAACIAVIVGLVCAFYAGIAAGGAIVLVALGLLGAALFCKR